MGTVDETLDKLLASPRLKVLQILHWGLLSGVVLFLLVALVLAILNPAPPGGVVPSDLFWLSIVAGIAPLLLWPLSRVAYEALLRRNPVMILSEVPAELLESPFYTHLQTAYLVRWWLIETGALFGCAVLLLLGQVVEIGSIPFVCWGLLLGPALAFFNAGLYKPSPEAIRSELQRLLPARA